MIMLQIYFPEGDFVFNLSIFYLSVVFTDFFVNPIIAATI